ncbi:50S ribosomal protein L18Ae [Methanobrevibacter sp. DSM 116169]|uniref:50S ribosomal protein L18Ae n=1 Tax=Methanobrevibacter sp. DSM 116169 TaxID=3242727 RepID=UPI0038FCFFB8
MITKIYRVKGKFTLGSEIQKFTKEYKATSKSDIEEKIYSHFGSKHNINQNQISIEDIEEISSDEVTDPIIKQIL